MKKLLTTLFVLLGFTFLKAQTVNNVPISEIESKYVEIITYEKTMSRKVIVELEFGQVNNVWKAKDAIIKDENDKTITFNSAIDALNWMEKYGYEYLDSYVAFSGGVSEYRYLLKRKDN